ncbi:ComEC/Rec2 family competence protein [Romboutsia sp. 13368]|uniref:ComEC/Rec2 family competence protein n=1 Tax=Romboutsia sp. 13368 TaxID=2708053 RepID=UPI0025FB4549|nr:ComEC/Rec2 family competence protein [Romboutsia sp. 13368]
MKKLFLTYITIIIIISFLLPNSKINHLSIHTIDVGQGDSILIQTPNNKNILIDGGDENSYHIVSSYLKKQKVKNIDYLIATHFDSDHIGGLDNIVENFKVSNVYAPNYKSDTISYQNLINSCLSKNLNLNYLSKGDFIKIEDDINLNILSPSYIGDDNNLNSIVCKIDYKNKSFLFTGDAEASNELNLINTYELSDVDFLKVGHHGSSSSTTPEFIEEVRPDIAVISCGYKNNYGHPHKSTLDTLEENNILTYRTDLLGDIVFYSDGETIYTTQNYNLNKK